MFYRNYCLHCLQGPNLLKINNLDVNNHCLLLFIIVYRLKNYTLKRKHNEVKVVYFDFKRLFISNNVLYYN